MNKKLIIGAIVFIIIIIIIYFLLNRKSYTHNILQKDLVFMTDDYVSNIRYDLVPESIEGRKYTYAFWINLNNVPENAIWNSDFKYEKPIIYHYGAPNVYYIPKSNSLKISVAYKNSSNEKDTYDFMINEIELQKWVHIGLVVNNKNINLYQDGELYASTVLDNVPWIPNKFLYLGQKNNNFNGYLFYLEYANTNFSSEQMKSLYNSSKNKVPDKLISYSQNFINNKNKT